MRRYQRYLQQNRDWLLKDAPRKANLRIYEAVYHFNLYMYLQAFLRRRRGQVFPEFPTGNGKIDLILRYVGQLYGLELKSFTDDYGYRQALAQAARYSQQLGRSAIRLSEISLVCFVETIDDTTRQKYETVFVDRETECTVVPIFIETAG